MSGFGTKTSDMDLCLMLSPHQVGINRGSNIIAHVLLNLLNELGKRDLMRSCRAFYRFFATSLINSIIPAQLLDFFVI